MAEEKVMERKADYFLRYTVDIPADEINLHKAFSTSCPCSPDWTFDEKEGWHHIVHKNMEL